jgi:hypothetical protein
MATNKDELYRMGVRAAKSGERDAARVMLEKVYAQDSRNISVLLWLAKVARTSDERETYLQRVLSIDPNNAIAKKGLSQITTRVNARRNKLMLRVGVIAYVLIVFMVAITAMIIFTP